MFSSSVLRITILLVLVLQTVCGDKISSCPSYCNCDVFNEQNRADCSAKRLISPSIDLSPAVEILDLSFNDITSLDNACFQDYYFLTELIISHNAIDIIELNAFVRLRRIKIIDLSYNRLEYLDERLFETNRQLQTLNLEGNKFMHLADKPLLRSKSLRVLSLRNAQLDHISRDLFSALPQLEQLDLSGNLMIILDFVAFNALKQLRHIDLRDNRWICDAAMLQAVETLKERGVKMELKNCSVDMQVHTDKVEQRFERMQVLEITPEELNATSEQEEKVDEEATHTQKIDENKDGTNMRQWHRPKLDNENFDYDEYDVRETEVLFTYSQNAEKCEGSRLKLCRKYRQCLKHSTDFKLESLKNGTYSESYVLFAFILGTAAGITIMLVMWTCVMCLRECLRCCRHKSVPQRERPLRGRTATPLIRSSHGQHIQSSAKRIKGRNAERPLQNPRSSAVVRYNQGNLLRQDNFVARLFGHPAHHYRTFNENTAILIRRLSRSNLLNRGANTSVRATDLISPSSSTLVADETATEHKPDVERPETPPPNYRDVIVTENNERRE